MTETIDAILTDLILKKLKIPKDARLTVSGQSFMINRVYFELSCCIVNAVVFIRIREANFNEHGISTDEIEIDCNNYEEMLKGVDLVCWNIMYNFNLSTSEILEFRISRQENARA